MSKRTNPTHFIAQEPLRLVWPLVAAVVFMLILGWSTSPAIGIDADPTLTLDERAELVELLQTSQAETLRLIEDVGEEDWLERPDPDSWSVGEVVEHLVLAETGLRRTVAALLASEPDPEWSQREASGAEGLVALAEDRSQKFQAPDAIQPSGKLSRAQTIAAFLAGRAESIQYVLETRDPLAAHSAMAPIGEPLDGKGWLGILGAHNLRHNAQIKEILAD